MSQAIGAGQIHADHFVPCIVIKIFQQAEWKYAGVVNQNVDVLKFICGGPDQRIDALKRSDVGCDAVCGSIPDLKYRLSNLHEGG